MYVYCGYFCCDLCVRLSLASFCFFFFKQKTAYEMRISDWSSDVCSSDLPALRGDLVVGRVDRRELAVGEVDELLRHALRGQPVGKIGRASCRERVCQYV